MRLRRFFLKFFVGIGMVILPWTPIPYELKTVLDKQLTRPPVIFVKPEPKPVAPAVTREESLNRTALDDITALTSLDMGGRRSGTSGEDKAVQYLTDELSALGLTPVGSETTFIQTFPLPSVRQAFVGNRLAFIGIAPTSTTLQGKNVLGSIQGTNPNEVIVLSAHHDHLGVYQNNLYAGANDNASGVACILDVLRKITQDGKVPKKTIVVAFWSAEEMGFVGSNYFVNHPLFPLANIKAMINVDTVGNGSLGDFALWSNTDNLPSQTLQELALKHGYFIHITPSGSHNSDQIVFSQVGIPAVTLLARDWLQGNHSPQDTAGSINKDQVTLATNLVYQAVKKLAFE